MRTPAPQLRLLAGPTVGTILALAAEAGTDLIVLGTHGRTGFERFMLGSVTEKVVRKAPCPVLTVPRRAEGAAERALFGRILCGVDFSDASRRAVDYGLSLAQEAKAHVTLLHVVEWLPDESFSKHPQFDVGPHRARRARSWPGRSNALRIDDAGHRASGRMPRAHDPALT